jgi:hypothetical protein
MTSSAKERVLDHLGSLLRLQSTGITKDALPATILSPLQAIWIAEISQMPADHKFAAQLDNIVFLDRIGSTLRWATENIAREELPENIRLLLRRLDRVEAKEQALRENPTTTRRLDRPNQLAAKLKLWGSFAHGNDPAVLSPHYRPRQHNHARAIDRSGWRNFSGIYHAERRRCGHRCCWRPCAGRVWLRACPLAGVQAAAQSTTSTARISGPSPTRSVRLALKTVTTAMKGA